MFNVGGGEILVIALIALIVVGPEQLPGLLRKLGTYAGQARQMSNALRDEFMAGAEPLQESVREFQRGMNDFSSTVSDAADVRKWGAGTDADPVVPRGYGASMDKPITTVDPPAAVPGGDAPAGGLSEGALAGDDAAAGGGEVASAVDEQRSDADADAGGPSAHVEPIPTPTREKSAPRTGPAPDAYRPIPGTPPADEPTTGTSPTDDVATETQTVGAGADPGTSGTGDDPPPRVQVHSASRQLSDFISSARRQPPSSESTDEEPPETA